MTAADGRLGLLGELERADEAITAELAELDELYAAVETLRGRAVELQQLFARLPTERAAAAAAAEEAEAAAVDARRASAQAAEELVQAEAEGDGPRLAGARRFELRARDHLHIAEHKASDAREHAARLVTRAEAAGAETARIEAAARELAQTLERRARLTRDAVARPGRGPEGVAEWGTGTRAALLVARSQLAAERDTVVRQAIELGAVLLGESLPLTSAAAVARRVEHELASR